MLFAPTALGCLSRFYILDRSHRDLDVELQAVFPIFGRFITIYNQVVTAVCNYHSHKQKIRTQSTYSPQKPIGDRENCW